MEVLVILIRGNVPMVCESPNTNSKMSVLTEIIMIMMIINIIITKTWRCDLYIFITTCCSQIKGMDRIKLIPKEI